MAYLLTLLNMNDNKNVKIYDISSGKDCIIFKIGTEIDDNIHIQSEVELGLERENGKIKFACRRI